MGCFFRTYFSVMFVVRESFKDSHRLLIMARSVSTGSVVAPFNAECAKVVYTDRWLKALCRQVPWSCLPPDSSSIMPIMVMFGLRAIIRLMSAVRVTLSVGSESFFRASTTVLS